jgi:ligand-binding sensor protein/AraC-like DNA-binding protein
VDCRGVPVTDACGFSEFCSQMRKDPARRAMCYSCDAHGGLQAAIDGRPKIYRCHAGLIDFSVPIVSSDRYLGAILCGQVRANNSADDPGFLLNDDDSWNQNEQLSDLYSEIHQSTVSKVRSAANLLTRLAESFVRQAASSPAFENPVVKPAVDPGLPKTLTGVQRPAGFGEDPKLVAATQTRRSDTTGIEQQPAPVDLPLMQVVADPALVRLRADLAADDLAGAMASLSEELDQNCGALVHREQIRMLEDELLAAAKARGAKVLNAVQHAMGYGRTGTGSDRYSVQLHLESLLRLVITADQRATRPNMAGLLNKMARQPNRGWTLSEAANYLGMSFSHASKQFKAYTGVNFVTYTSQRRLERAQLMLRYTDMKVARIAKTLGFLPNYFSRTFREATGCSPSDYRRKFAVTRMRSAA